MIRERIEEWWPLVARILMFFVGAGVFVQQATVPNPPGAQESLLAGAVGLMAPLAAYGMASAVGKARQKAESESE
jgi:hypothetical protein